MLGGQYDCPLGVVAFNAAAGWSRDVSTDVALEVYKRATVTGDTLPESTREPSSIWSAAICAETFAAMFTSVASIVPLAVSSFGFSFFEQP